jgi:digeranylgeranylglycerophospholipid reductase
MYDVLIVGGGPAGLSTANTLAQSGAKVLAIERKKDIGEPVECGEGLTSYEYRKIGIDGDYVVWEADGVELVFPKGSIMISQKMLSIDRKEFEKGLAEIAIGNGASIKTGEKVRNVSYKNNGWKVKTENGNEYTAKYMIAADGYRSRVGEILDVYERRDVIPGTSVRGKKKDVDNVFKFFFSSDFPHGYGYVFPRGYGYVNAGVVLKGGNIIRVDEMFLNKNKIDAVKRRGGGIPFMFKLKQYYSYRSLVVGDAAGLANSITYGGIYPAVMSGRIGGKSIIRAMENDDDYPEYYQKQLKNANFFQKNPEKEHNMVYSMTDKEMEIIGDIANGREFSEISLFDAFMKIYRNRALRMLPRLFRLYMYFRSNSHKI